jgi:ParB-like chromosome segregation protein Spo0J/Sec-independent protein translocase protein TatA
VGGYQRWVCGWHRPVNGDKIQFQWDGTPGIQINASEASRYPQDAILGTDRFPVLALNRSQWRQQFIIHSHEVDDADYYEGEMAGAVEGVGLRSQIYWAWWLRDEMLSWCVDFMRKVGTLGLLIFRYESGNKEAKAAAEANARTASQRVAITMPVVGGRDNGMTSGIEHIPANTGGVETLQDMIANYFERHMERLIVGQSMSSGGGGAGGLEGDGRANLAADTKWQLLKFDAENLAETLTTDLVRPLAKMNFPDAKFDIKFEFVIESPENEKKMQAVANACSLGVTFRMDDVRELTGMEAPDEGDETVGGQPQQQTPDTGKHGDGGPEEQTPYAGDEKWITIGGREEGDQKHVGGFPVQISSDGTILKGGPKGLRGKNVKDVKSHFSGNRQVRSDRTSEPESLGRGRPKQPEYGPGYNLPVSDLHIDPDRFQYKLNTDNDSGVTDKFKDTDKWDSTLAGIVAVWRDPKDGKDYVINGHHRFEMAKRFGAKELRVQYLNASDEQSARAQGALINIGEGNGTAIDAAKYLRDSNVTPEEMKAKGISLSGKIAADGIILSKLADPLFHRLTLGQLDEGRAKAIATHLGNDPQGQAELFNHIESEEDRRGSRLGNDVVERMAARWSAAPKVAGTPDLFGDAPEQSTFVDQAILESKLRGKLADDVRNFAAVKSDKRASAVAGAGNVLNTEKNKEEHQKAAEMLFAFDRLSVYKGEVSNILREEGANYATAKNKSEREAITKRASERVRAAIAGGSGPKVEVDSGAKRGGADGGGQTPEGYQKGQDDPLTLYAFDANEPRDESGKWTSGGCSAPKPPEVDATKPHFIGSKASPETFFVLPGQGEGGKPKQIYMKSGEYALEVGKHYHSLIGSMATDALDRVRDIADGGTDADTPSEKFNAIDEALYAANDDIQGAIDRWSERYFKNTSDIYYDDVKLVDTDKLKELVATTKKQIETALYEDPDSPVYTAQGFEDEWDDDAMDWSLNRAARDVESSLDDLKQAFEDHRTELDEKIEERDQEHNDQAYDFAEELNGDHGDDGEEATERAAEINAELAKAGSQYRVANDGESWVHGYGDDLEDYPGKPAEDPENYAAFDESQHARDHGKFASKPGSSGESSSTPASGKLKSLLALRHLVTPVVRRKVSAFVQKTYTKLESKYGPTGAKLVLGGMVALLPLPVPGSSVIPIAIAEGVKRLRRLFAGNKEAVAMYEAIPEAMDAEMLAGAIREMLEAVYDAAGEDAPEVDDAKIIEVAASLIDGDELADEPS